MRITPQKLIEFKRKGKKIVMITCYDYPFAKIADETEIDIILVGDSLGMVIQGHPNTLGVTLEHMIYHTEIVARAVKRAMVIADMPFLTYQISKEEAIKNCGLVMKKTQCQAVKLEGGEEIVETIDYLTKFGIPVMGHIGLTPQKVHKFGGFKVQGRTQKDRERLIKEAKLLEEAGCFSIVLEGIPWPLAKEITENLTIPTIGIGAGPYCDGQVLVLHDVLGLYEEIRPKFVKRYLELAKLVKEALINFRDDVREGRFPTLEHSYDVEGVS